MSVISQQWDECMTFLGKKSALTPCITWQHLLQINSFHGAGLLGFLIFLGTIDRDQWHPMGKRKALK